MADHPFMRYDILHELPGRLRVRCRNLRLDSNSRVELRKWVDGHAEIAAAKLSARTGNLLVIYAKSVKRETILFLLDDLRLFEAANIGERDSRGKPTAGEAAVAVLARQTSSALVGAILPKPIRMLGAGFRFCGGLLALGDRLLGGQAMPFFFEAAKFALLCLLTLPGPARFLLGAGFAMAGRLAFEANADRIGPEPGERSATAAIPYAASQMAG